MKKVIIFIMIVALILVLTPGIIYAGPKGKGPAEKATGEVGYEAGGLQCYAEFNAFELTSASSVDWNLSGIWIFDFDLSGAGSYLHDAVLSQTGTSITGNGGHVAGAATYAFEWTITSASITGVNVEFTMEYTVGAVGTTMTMIGTVNPADGTMAGTWTDDYLGGVRTGSWSSTSGAAIQTVTGFDGKGMFHYSDVNGNWYYADVKYVNVDGADAYFAGLVTSASSASWVGNWVSVAVHDGGEPAYLVDAVWGIFTDMNTAKLNVANKVKPNGKFDITSGNLQVHTND